MRKSLLTLAMLGISSLFAQNIKDSSIQVSATVNATQKQITIQWTTTDAQSFFISRKTPDTLNWNNSAPYGTVSGSSNSFTDTGVEIGKIYEYRILKLKDNGVIRAFGYVASGINVPFEDYKKNILILTDSSTYFGIDSGIWKQLVQDYYMDGYGVHLQLISEYHTPPQIKSTIKTWYQGNTLTNIHCLLIGRVPVAYSGLMLAATINLPPDAHTDHGGAWPTDLYYAEMDGSWTDNGTMTSGVSRNQNKNNPGDGKFDQHFLPDDIDLQIGRIDMRNLPAQGLSDIELVKRYLNKLHLYKTGAVKVRDKAFISDNFGYLGGEMPMRSGWNNASAVVGKANITASGNFFDSTSSKSFLWANTMGAGSYANCSGVGPSSKWNDSVLSVFNVSFGSYFGDWDNSDNFLRSCIASKGLTLTNVWAHRPHWYFHQMAMGSPIGVSCLAAQNNLTDFSFETGYVGSLNGNYLDRRISMNLLGDPTLRLHYLAMPKNLFAIAQNNNTQVKLSWVASSEPGLLGYNIYRTSKPGGIYYKINGAPISSQLFIDSNPFLGNNYYVLKAVKLETSTCGTYMNHSLGIQAAAFNVNGNNNSIRQAQTLEFSLYPNPASGRVYYETESGSELSVTDINGKQIYSTTTKSRIGEINCSDWAKGVYIVIIRQGAQSHFEKLVIQ